MPDRPHIRIEISGPRHAGKSVLAAMIRRMLHAHDIGASGPIDLPQRSRGTLAKALINLAERGLSVELVETPTGPPQIDATIGMRRPELPPRSEAA